MTPSQEVTREERLAIMMFDAGCSENYAQRYCDLNPEMYGTRDIDHALSGKSSES
jgi:hypothetical protein